jgi:hypothetical protein
MNSWSQFLILTHQTINNFYPIFWIDHFSSGFAPIPDSDTWNYI